MKSPLSLLAITFLSLGILALALVPQAYLRGDMGAAFIMMIVALIFFNRLQGKLS